MFCIAGQPAWSRPLSVCVSVSRARVGSAVGYATRVNVTRESISPGVVLLVGTLVCFAWFFQGTGLNQNAQFDTVRAIVERHTFDITEFASNTGDTSVVDGRVYANKPPGLAVLATRVYWVIFHAECLLRLSVSNEVNMH